MSREAVRAARSEFALLVYTCERRRAARSAAHSRGPGHHIRTQRLPAAWACRLPLGWPPVGTGSVGARGHNVGSRPRQGTERGNMRAGESGLSAGLLTAICLSRGFQMLTRRASTDTHRHLQLVLAAAPSSSGLCSACSASGRLPARQPVWHTARELGFAADFHAADVRAVPVANRQPDPTVLRALSTRPCVFMHGGVDAQSAQPNQQLPAAMARPARSRLRGDLPRRCALAGHTLRPQLKVSGQGLALDGGSRLL